MHVWFLEGEKLIGQDLEVVCDSDNDRDHCVTFSQTIPDICCISCINLFCVRYQIRVSAWEHAYVHVNMEGRKDRGRDRGRWRRDVYLTYLPTYLPTS